MAKYLREIHIRPVCKGFVVTVDCHTIAYNSVDEMLKDISSYLNAKDVAKHEAEFMSLITDTHTGY